MSTPNEADTARPKAAASAEATRPDGRGFDAAALLDKVAADLDADAAETLRVAATELRTQSEAVDQLSSELKALQEQLLRQTAEFRNYRRRTDEEKKSLLDLGKSMVAKHMLDVFDDFRRAVEAFDQADAEAPSDATLEEGVRLVYQKFSDELGRLGVEPIEAVGQPFNEHEHDAMMQQPAPEGTEPGTVLQEIQRGYRMGDRILRHTQVVVAS